MATNQQFAPNDANTSQATSPWTEWSTVFADPNSSVNLPVQATPPANSKAANPPSAVENDDALMDCYNG